MPIFHGVHRFFKCALKQESSAHTNTGFACCNHTQKSKLVNACGYLSKLQSLQYSMFPLCLHRQGFLVELSWWDSNTKGFSSH